MGRSLKTTNCIESLLACVDQDIGKVDWWRNSNQKHRWLASSLLDIEPRLNRICGYKYLPELRRAIKKEIEKRCIAEEPLSISISMETHGLAFCNY